MDFRKISITEVLAAHSLLAEYAQECSIPEIGAIDPQRETYLHMEQSGLMHTFGVFEEGIFLVGFATLLLFVLPHYGKKIANVESLYLEEKYRSKFGRKLMLEIEAFAEEQKCVAMLYNARKDSRLEQLLGKLPLYKRTNSVFLRSFQ